MLLAIAVALGIVTAVSAVIGRIGEPQAPQPAATAEPAPPPVETPTGSPTPATLESPTPTPTPTPTITELPALVGSARAEDPEGDVTGPDGDLPPDPEPAADLLAVQLDGDGTALEVTFELAGPPPPVANSLVWSLELRLDDELVYSVTVQQLGEQVYAGVLDWDSSRMQTLEEVVLAQRTVTVSVPAQMLARIDGGFTWFALGQQDEAYEDFIPDDPADPLPTFPS